MLAINQRTQNIALLMIFATIGVFSGVLLTRTGETLDAKPAIPDDIPADARIRYVIDHQSDEEHVFAMHWSAAGDLWFVGSRSDGLLSLNRYDPRTSQHDRWELPGEASPGPYTYLVEHSDGSWWVAANYTLWRFDPRSEDAVVHEVLEQAHPLRLPEADDRGTPLPGTWITGMVANGDGVALARHNVPALFHVDANGDIRTLASLDAPPKA